MNPGSHAAHREGCCCPMTENQFGRGAPGGALFGQPQFITARRCPLHGEGQRWSYTAPADYERIVLGVHKAPRVREVGR